MKENAGLKCTSCVFPSLWGLKCTASVPLLSQLGGCCALQGDHCLCFLLFERPPGHSKCGSGLQSCGSLQQPLPDGRHSVTRQETWLQTPENKSVSQATEPSGTRGRGDGKLGAWTQWLLLSSIPNTNTLWTALCPNVLNAPQTPPLETENFFMLPHCRTLYPTYW